MTGGFDPDHFESLFRAEDRHFWFRARNQAIAALASRAVAALSPGYTVLEMGCGDGNALRVLEKACSGGIVVGMDLYAEGLRYARRRVGCGLVQGDVRRAPFARRFHLIGIFDVLEHIPDDIGLLRDLREILHDDGALLLTVPAHPRLWSYFDELAGHCRRYRLEELRDKLQAAGLRPEFLSPYMMSVYPLMRLGRKMRARRAAAATPSANLREELRIVPLVNGALRALLSLENRRIGKQRTLPAGSSLIALARKSR
jgi:SAM-dependent methyltransferase